MKEQMPQSKTGTFRACLQLPLHLEALAALCKMLPELLKLVKAQQQSSRLACVPCWDSYTMHVLRGLRRAALSKTQMQQAPCSPGTGSVSCGGEAKFERGRSSSPCQVCTVAVTAGRWPWVLATPLQQVLCCG